MRGRAVLRRRAATWRPTGADIARAVALAGAAVAESVLWRLADDLGELRFPSAALLVVAGVLFVSALLRRAAPGWAPLGPAAVLAWLAVGQPPGVPPFVFATAAGVAVLGYLAGSATGRLVPPVGFAALAAGAAGWSLLAGTPERALFVPVALTIVGGLPWLLGRYRRQQQALVRASADRIAQLEREQDMVAERARLRERAELAEEMHDSLGHELSLVALRAGALELAPELAEPHRTAAGELRAAAGAATDRLAEIVKLLRDGPPPQRPAGEPVSQLVDRVRDSGMAVTLTSGGDPPPEVAPTVHRMVQEALTNAAKHAPGAPVTVDVRSDPAATTVTVGNPLRGAPAGPPGAGRGLAALRERARLLGGELAAGATTDGFRLSARLPHPVPEEGR